MVGNEKLGIVCLLIGVIRFEVEKYLKNICLARDAQKNKRQGRIKWIRVVKMDCLEKTERKDRRLLRFYEYYISYSILTIWSQFIYLRTH